jgi:hypothetical protein
MPLMYPGIPGGAFEEAVVRVGQGQQNRAFNAHNAGNLAVATLSANKI